MEYLRTLKGSLHKIIIKLERMKKLLYCKACSGEIGKYHPHQVVNINTISNGTDGHPVPPDEMQENHFCDFPVQDASLRV